MKLVRLRLYNFRSFGPEPTVVELTDMTFLLGPNGAGKTAVLQALARMFGLDPAQRRIKRSDFHVPASEVPEDAPEQRTLWVEADFEFPELEQDEADGAALPAVPGNFAHMQLVAAEGPAQVRFRLKATIDQDDDIEESLTFVIREGNDGNPTEESRVSKQVGSKVLSGELTEAFDIDKLRPAVFTLIAIEEPENSLSPHYLGRVVRTLTTFAEGQDSQALVATHAPSLLRRVPPESVRYLGLNEERSTVVKSIELPTDETAQKFVREGVQAFPELYFSRMVILGEGDSEQIVLPRLLEARGILADDASISVVPLGGRHVNHFWRLLNGLGIPHVTLLDLDVARYQGGWGRIKYAANQLLSYADIDGNDLTQDEIDDIPKWNSDDGIMLDDLGWIARLEALGVYFSTPLDLDFMMMTHYPAAYRVKDDDLEEPDEETVKAVLGKSHDVLDGQYSDEQQSYFDAYHQRFKLDSKPTSHIRSMANLDNEKLIEQIPDALDRMLDAVEEKVAELPE